jgi:phospholipid/cholesterol/gamma-HCH transport system ATP-binding protein
LINEKGFVIITHKVMDALKVADRFMFLKDGTIVFDGNKEQLIHATIPELQVFLSELYFNMKTP